MSQPFVLDFAKTFAPAQPQATIGQDVESPAQAQAHFCMTQSLDISSKLLKSFWEIQELSHSRLEEEFKKVQQESEQLKQREEVVSIRLAEAENKEKAAEADLHAAMKNRAEAINQTREAKRIEAENNKTLDRLKPLLQKEKKINEILDAGLQALQDAENERKAAEAASANAAAYLQQVTTIKKQIETLQPQFWPASLSGEQWHKWRASLQEKGKQDANSALVIASFHRLCAAEKAVVSQELCAALHEVGHRLYTETNNPEFVAQIATALNEAAGGRFWLKFARPGESPSDEWMKYQPGMPSVRQVRNWAVFKVDSAGGRQIAFKADVQ